MIDGCERIFSQPARRSSLPRGIEPGCRILIEVTLARVFPLVESTVSLAPILARAAQRAQRGGPAVAHGGRLWSHEKADAVC